jgi:hypothetical protein
MDMRILAEELRLVKRKDDGKRDDRRSMRNEEGISIYII